MFKKCITPPAKISIHFICLPKDEPRFERERNEMDQFAKHGIPDDIKPLDIYFDRYNVAHLKVKNTFV